MTLAALLPRIATGVFSADLWNGVVGLAGTDLPLAGGGSVRFALSVPPDATAWLASIILSDGRTTFVQVKSFPFRQLFNVGLDSADIGALPAGLREALLDGMFAAVLELLPPAVRNGSAIAGQGLASGMPAHRATPVQWFDVTLTRPDGHKIELAVGCDRSTILQLFGERLVQHGAVSGPLADSMLLPAHVSLGRLALSYDDFVRLEPGALVVLPQQPTGTAMLRVGDLSYSFSPAQGGWACLGGQPIATGAGLGDNMNDLKDQADQGQGGISVAGLRVAVDFDIAQLSVPVGALTAWQAGTVVNLDLPQPADGLEVTIRANGEVIGQGDLVRIDDRLAVRITRLLLRP